MKKITYGAGILFFALLLVQCKTSKIAYLTKEEAKTQFSTEQLAQGKVLWEAKCQKCHKLFPTTMYDAKNWKPILDKMVVKAKLEEQDAQLVRAFVIANAK